MDSQTVTANVEAERAELRLLRLERRLSYRALSAQIAAITGEQIEPATLNKWIRGLTKPEEIHWYVVQRYLSAVRAQGAR